MYIIQDNNKILLIPSVKFASYPAVGKYIDIIVIRFKSYFKTTFKLQHESDEHIIKSVIITQ